MRFRLLEKFLFSKLLLNPSEIPKAVMRAARMIEKRRGLVQVDELCRSLDISRKHLASLSKRYLGMTPKRYIRLSRFRAASELIATPEAGDFAQVAYLAGYVDQSHFINEPLVVMLSSEEPERFGNELEQHKIVHSFIRKPLTPEKFERITSLFYRKKRGNR